MKGMWVPAVGGGGTFTVEVAPGDLAAGRLGSADQALIRFRGSLTDALRMLQELAFRVESYRHTCSTLRG